MDEASFLQVQSIWCFVFFTFAACFSFFSFFLFLLRLLRPWCDCEVCRAYLSSSWAAEFDNLCDWYAHLLRRSPTATVHVHVLRSTVTANPENVEHILKTNFPNYPKGKPFSAILGDLLGRGIFNADGDAWRFQRKMASLELGSLAVRSFALDVTAAEIRTRLLPLLSSFTAGRPNGAVLDLQDAFRRFSFDTICKFSFGLDPGCLRPSLPVSDLAVAFDAASRLSAERAMAAAPAVWKIKRLLNLGSERQLREAIKMVSLLAEEVIQQKRRMGFAGQRDLLSRFMSSVVDNDRYLRDIVVSFLLAGRDTVASALTTFFWLAAQRPDVVAAIRAESDRVMGPGAPDPESEPRLATFEQLREMHYLHAAVHESLRLYPPVQFDSKFSQDDDVLPDGTFVRRGTRVTYHPYAMGRMERVWGSDCEVFRPERWLRDGAFVPENPFKYPVFQAGLRVCLGKEMALVEVKSVALSLIRQFDIRVMNAGRVPRFVPGLTATVRGGLPVVVRERRKGPSKAS